MAESLRILILEDNAADAELNRFELEDAGLDLTSKVVATREEYVQALQDYYPDLILSDYDLPNYDGALALAEARSRRPDTPFILVTGAISEDRAIDILTQGAKDYVLKTRLQQRLVPAVRRALAEAEELRARKQAETELREAHRTLEARVKIRTAELQAEITERQRTEEALQDSEKRYRRLFESAKDGILILDADTGKVVDANPFLLKLLGYSYDALYGKYIWEIGLFKDIAASKDAFKILQDNEYIRYEDLPLETLDGKSIAVEFVSNVYLVDHSRVIQCNIRDITVHKRAEAALRESEERFRTIFEEAPLGIVMTSSSFAFEKANPAFCCMMGYSADELRSMTFANITHPDYLKQDMENVIKVGRGEMPFYQTEKRYISKSGKVLWGSLTVSGIRDEHGALRHYLSTVIDVTERKMAEEEKAKLQAQFLQSQKMESVGRLAGGIAHDFNNMLAVILGHAEIALEQVDPTQSLYSDLLAIGNAAERSADLTRQLLAFARKQTVSPRVLDMNKAVADTLKMLRQLIGEDVHLAWLPGVDLWSVKIDPSQIDQVLANLCVNARDAIAGVGKVTIETKNVTFDEDYCADHVGFAAGEYVLLAVSDNGCGMNKEILERLFEPFFTTKEMGKGTGLGLATVYGIVKQNLGFINVYSEPDQGTTFKIYLPRHVGKAEEIRTEGAPATAIRGQETILLAEDEPAMLELCTMLLKMQGYTVLAASTPGEAIRLAREHAGEVHLLITDVVMPEMNGRDLAKNLLSLYPNLKRLFMSGYTADVIAHHGVLDEGVHFMQKPFSRKDLATKVREALDQK